MNQLTTYLQQHQAAHLEWARDLCRIPSISTKPEHNADTRAAAEWTRDLCTSIGLKATLHETGGHPLVYAERCEHPGQPVYLVYGHIDVQPEGDLSLWNAAPFEPVIKDGLLICRGSSDDKGQVLIHLRAAAAWLATTGKLPINLKFLIEGEEEIASPNLGPFLRQHAELLRCDHILISDTGMYADGWPTITYGTRGLLYKEIRLHGPKHDLHSGSFGGTLTNPANALAHLLASLHDAQGRVAIPGFYDTVDELSAAERGQLAELPLNEQRYAADIGVPALAGEQGYSTNERRWIRPTLDVNGIYGGFMAEGANTIIPRSAGAKVSMRLVPSQSGERLSQIFDETIRTRCPNTVRLEILNHGAADAYVAPLDSPPMAAARQALQEAFDRTPALIREGGSLPILALFKQVLKADCLMLGFAGPNCNAHGPNENIVIADMDRGADAIARLYGHLGA
ncbi:MAG: dipeptidase [Phycisphaerales bacterium]|nr:dipeptidase [Phycisphaerales bacterium]